MDGGRDADRLPHQPEKREDDGGGFRIGRRVGIGTDEVTSLDVDRRRHGPYKAALSVLKFCNNHKSPSRETSVGCVIGRAVSEDMQSDGAMNITQWCI